MAWQFFVNSGKEKFIDREKNPSGMIVQYGGATIPSGWLSCDGSQVRISSYPDLYYQIKTNYGALTDGAGNAGTTHFRLPDLRGRIPVGYQAGIGDGLYHENGFTITGASRSGNGSLTGPAISGRPIGTTAGTEKVTLTSAESGIAKHNHTIGTSGSHNHTITSSTSHNHQVYGKKTDYKQANFTPWAGVRNTGTVQGTYSTGSSGIGAQSLSGTSGITATDSKTAEDAANSHDNIQPSLVLNFIIKT